MAVPDNRQRTVNGMAKGTANRKPDRRVEEALERLESGVSRVLDGEEFRRYLSVAAKFHHYSANNCLSIFMQRPDATRVAGYRKWQQLGRQVRKGEKGIKILAPISRTVAEDEETGEKVRALVGFKTATVFDVSQTDGEELPEAPRPEDLDREEGAEIAEKVYEGLLSFCEAEGVAVEFEERRQGDYGSYQRKERRIVLNTALPATEKATTLAHELAHHLLHAQEYHRAKKAIREIEAEGAAFVACAAFGLDTSRFTFAYIANYAGEPEALKGALERIQGAARRLIEAVGDSMEGGAVAMAARKITERRAARAARQLLYHRRLSEWISRKTAENEATLEGYLIGSGGDRVVLFGGYVVERASEDQENPMKILEPIAGPEYEQMELPEDFKNLEVS